MHSVQIYLCDFDFLTVHMTKYVIPYLECSSSNKNDDRKMQEKWIDKWNDRPINI